MKKIFILLTLLAVTQMASAVPAKRVTKKVRQSDGTTLTMVLRGDEHVHYYATLDGVPVMKSATGDYTYVRLTDEGLSASDVIAHTPALRTAGEQAFVNAAPALKKQLSLQRNERLQPINAARAAVAEKRRQARRAPMLDAAQENKKGLIILVNFKDKKLQDSSNKAAFDRFANTDGLQNDVNYGSIHDYFKAQSYGQFNVTFDIAGPVTVSKNMSYYGGNDTSGNDKCPEEMVYEAVKLANSEVNYADYDWDGDGEVENIYVVYAGYGEASGADENTIWPHQWQLLYAYTRSQLKFDGVLVNTYACGSELRGDGYKYDEQGYMVTDRFGNPVVAESGELDGVGTMCHEFSHCLGLPDFYDTNYTYFGMDVWSVMDAGCHNEDSNSPTNYTAYERWFSGWLEPIELNEPTAVKAMPALAEEPVAYIIYNDKNHNEYYLLENRQPIGFDRGKDNEYAALSGYGLMISHVTYDQSAWYGNTVNTNKMQRMTLIPADGTLYGTNDAYNDYLPYMEKYQKNPTQQNYNAYEKAYHAAMNKYYAGLAGDLWPYTSSDGKVTNCDLTDDSTPAATLNIANNDGKKLMHKPITEITQTPTGRTDNRAPLHTISFKFMGGKNVSVPTNLMATDLTTTGFTASWTASADADSYHVELREKRDASSMAESLLLYEDFAALTTGDKDGNIEVTSKLDGFTSTPGWTGSKVFQGGIGCKIGNRSGGYLQTPQIAPESGTLTIILAATPYSGDDANMTVEAINAEGQTLDTQSLEMNGNNQVLQLTVSEPCRIKIRPAVRAYVKLFAAYDGEFTLEDYEALQTLDVKRQALTSTFSTQETSHVFTGLNSESSYAFRVQAVDAEGYESAWTEWVEVDLTSVGIAGITPATPAATKWFDLQGRRVRRPIEQGTYIMRSGTAARKVIIQ